MSIYLSKKIISSVFIMQKHVALCQSNKCFYLSKEFIPLQNYNRKYVVFFICMSANKVFTDIRVEDRLTFKKPVY